jgi:hypothetical protein
MTGALRIHAFVIIARVLVHIGAAAIMTPLAASASPPGKCSFKIIKDENGIDKNGVVIPWSHQNFSVELAERMRGFHRVKDLESIIGEPPAGIVKDEDCTTIYKWYSTYAGGTVMATVYPTPSDLVKVMFMASGRRFGDSIGINNYGLFLCDQCDPPISEYGRRPPDVNPSESWPPR